MVKAVAENADARKELLALLVLGEGMTVANAARDPRISISVTQAYNWAKTDVYKRKIREILAETQLEVQMESKKRVQQAFKTIDLAMDSPAATPTMLNAARLILQYAAGSTITQDSGNVFHVEINTGLNPNAAEEQARRFEELRRNTAIDAPFTVVE